MSALYPLLMTPRFDPRPWGRFDLSPVYSGRFEERIGESWLTGDNCTVRNGTFAGRSLAELASDFGRELIGDAPSDGARFPLLTKFLFPEEKLSVQVHPDDDSARSLGEPWGKTECWYVAHARPGAQIALGLRTGVTLDEFERSIHAHSAESLLNWITISPGEMIYVAGGTVHTLGPGSIIVETQQQSDTTFRLYDYGRPRELHLKDGLRVVKARARSGKVPPRPSVPLDQEGNWRQPLVRSSYFAVDKFELHAAADFPHASAKSSVDILVATEGVGSVEATACPALEFGKGDAVVIPAGRQFRIQPHQRFTFLKAYVPGVPGLEPDVVLD
jgi:mannose-6-phosphate isomerase